MAMTTANRVRIGNAQGFWGDSTLAPARLLQQQPDLDYLTLDYLAEVSMSILAIQRERDRNAGYARDFLEVVRSLIPLWKAGAQCILITNAGGLNPLGCAVVCQELLSQAGCSDRKIGIVSGDDIHSLIQSNPSAALFNNLETQASCTTICEKIVTANVYIGAQPIVEALRKGANIVITGRVADPSLTVAACVAHFGWSWNEYDCLAGATIAGHLIECGTQVTGGICTNWLSIPHLATMGFPIVEVANDGSCIVTKPIQSGGRVSVETVKEQLLYEIGDPDNYLSPDVTVSFLGVSVQEVGVDRILVSGAKGRSASPTYKVSTTYRDGYKVEGLLTIFGHDAAHKARLCGEMIVQRIRDAGFTMQKVQIECLGAGAVVPGVIPISSADLFECVLRICIADLQPAVLEFFSRELASLVTSGPQGVTGYSSGRPRVRAVFGYWPCLVERSQVVPVVQVLEREAK